MSNNSSVPGLTNPTMQSMAAGNPRDSAIANTAAASAKQAEANRMTAGSKKRGGAGVVVPTRTATSADLTTVVTVVSVAFGLFVTYTEVEPLATPVTSHVQPYVVSYAQAE